MVTSYIMGGTVYTTIAVPVAAKIAPERQVSENHPQGRRTARQWTLQ